MMPLLLLVLLIIHVHGFITADGAWLIAQRAEQRRRFKAILCTKPKTYARIKEERRRAEKQGTSITEQFQHAEEQEKEEEKEVPTLDGFFLVNDFEEFSTCVD